MHRDPILKSLDHYQATWAHQSVVNGRVLDRDQDMIRKFKSFVLEYANCFERSHYPGHITGSALVVNRSLTKVLLTHHKKLNIWLQLGGHADGNSRASEVAMQEALEESNLTDLRFLAYEGPLFGAKYAGQLIPFDLDSHLIPPNAKDPQHWHFDVRFLLVGNDQEAPKVSHESHDVCWFSLPDARLKTQEDSMERQFLKVEAIRNALF